MTANPSWSEVEENVFTYDNDDDDPDDPSRSQSASDCPDIVQKMKAMLKDLKGGLFSDILGFVFTTEFQKRGLSHIYLLLFLKGPFKICDAAHVDSIVSAEIPGQDGYPEYARPENGRTYTNCKGHTFDNCSVIPYNLYLSARYDCHINVEICTSVKAIKYIHKYIYKGHDRATIAVGEDIDEILDHIGGHYVGPVEAVWHVMEFPMHEEKPSVYHLPVHLEDKQTVYVDNNDNVEEVLDCDTIKKTHLTEWFVANATLEGTSDITYHDFPQRFVWEKERKKWKPRS